MNDQQREVQRRLRVIKHAENLGNVRKTCRYFGLSRSTFYRWKSAYKKEGELGLTNKSTAPKHHPKQLSQEVVDKVIHLRRRYHLGPIRIVWYMGRYHGINICDASVYRVLCRHGLNRLPRNVGRRKVHTKRYEKTGTGSSYTSRC